MLALVHGSSLFVPFLMVKCTYIVFVPAGFVMWFSARESLKECNMRVLFAHAHVFMYAYRE